MCAWDGDHKWFGPLKPIVLWTFMVHSTKDHIGKDLCPVHICSCSCHSHDFPLFRPLSHSHTSTPPLTDRWLNLCIVPSTCYHVLLIWLRRWTQATHIKIHCHTILCVCVCAGSLLSPFTCVSVAYVRGLQRRALCELLLAKSRWIRTSTRPDILRLELWD